MDITKEVLSKYFKKHNVNHDIGAANYVDDSFESVHQAFNEALRMAYPYMFKEHNRLREELKALNNITVIEPVEVEQEPCFKCGKTLREQMGKNCYNIDCYRQRLIKN